jgi:voltage-gated potassium channel
MSQSAQAAPEHSNSYSIFMLVLTIMSLAIMVLLLLPLSEATHQVLFVYDNVVCVVFLVDFAYNFRRASSKRHYFINERGWLDLIGSIPTFGVFRFTALLRLARLSRLARIARLLGGENKKRLVADVLKNRGQYAAFITVLAGFMVLVTSSVLVLQFESKSADANITTGGDALWWAVVTITTVGYGDKFPVTGLGRLTGVAVMFAGVGIIGALASILASILVPQPEKPDAAEVVESTTSVLEGELAGIRAELAALRQSLAADQPRSPN